MVRCCVTSGCCLCGIFSGCGSGLGALPAIRWCGGESFSGCGMGEYRLLPGVSPPLLPGRKFPVFNGLRLVVACKIVITKGLRLNLSRQRSYGLNAKPSALGRGLFLTLYI